MASPKIEILIPQEEIQKRIAELGAQISAEYGDRPLVLVGVLKGSFMFLADLVRQITSPVRVEFIGAKSYEGTSTSGQVQITKDLDKPISDEDVLLVEDIIDTGLTLNYLLHVLSQRSHRGVPGQAIAPAD
jgi:hypoxanthine phosphoribosyltransferase